MARTTNKQLVAQLRERANLQDFSPDFLSGLTGDKVREITKIYRDSWLNPIIDEVERRLVKNKDKD